MKNFFTIFIVILQILFTNQALASLTCTLSNNGLSFGSIVTNDGNPETSIGTVSVSCVAVGTHAVAYDISFDITGGSDRKLDHAINGSEKLDYNLYKTASHIDILGDGTNSTHKLTHSYSITNEERTDHFTIYGKIPDQPLAVDGNYDDTIQITLTY